MYEKLEKRYKEPKYFPAYVNYTRDDKIDEFNCTIDFLVPDSLNKDSLRKNISDYIQ